MALDSGLKRARILAAAIAGLMALGISPAHSAQFTAGDDIDVTGEYDDMVMAAGGSVRVRAQVRDDIFAAGGEVITSESSADHLITAGGSLTLTNVTARDIVAAGGEIWISGAKIQDDLVLSGGRVMIDSRSTFSGTAVMMGGDLAMAGTVEGDVTAAGGRIRLDGRIGGNADLSAERLKIGPGARIDGNLVHRARIVEISPDAKIAGTVTALDYDQRLTERDLLYRLIGVGIVVALAFLVGGIVLSLVLAGLLPRLMEGTHETLHRRTVPSLGVGVLWAVGAPLAVAIFMVLVIGIPLGFFLLGVFLLTIPLAGAVVSHFIGREIRSLTKRDAPEPEVWGRVAWTLLGAVILMILGLIPIIGVAIPVLVFLLGTGAAVLLFLERNRPAPALPA